MINISEVWHHDSSEDRLFALYIIRFGKIKTDACGDPNSASHDDEKEKDISDYEEKEGIQLEREKISNNPGLRAPAKICSNSFWWRLVIKDDKPSTKHLTEPKEFFDLLLPGRYCVTSCDILHDDVLQVGYRREQGFIEANPNTNVVLAAWVLLALDINDVYRFVVNRFATSNARLHLFKYIDMLKDSLQNFDRLDSVCPPSFSCRFNNRKCSWGPDQ